MNRAKLRGKIIAAGYTQAEFADKLGMSQSTLSRKINDFNLFTSGEIRMICEILNITDPVEICEIFLPEVCENAN